MKSNVLMHLRRPHQGPQVHFVEKPLDVCKKRMAHGIAKSHLPAQNYQVRNCLCAQRLGITVCENGCVRNVWATLGYVQGLWCAKMSLCVTFNQFQRFPHANMLIFLWNMCIFKSNAKSNNGNVSKVVKKHNGFLLILNLASIQPSNNDEFPCEILIYLRSLKFMKLKMCIFRYTCDKRWSDGGSGSNECPKSVGIPYEYL